MFKTLWLALPAIMVCAHVYAVSPAEMVNLSEYDLAESASKDSRFVLSLSQTAAYLDYCKKPEMADEIRQYLKSFTLMGAQVEFEGSKASEESLRNIRGMYISRKFGSIIAMETATTSALHQLEPLSKPQKTKLCAFAVEGYDMFKQLRMRAQSIMH